jgi:acyl transferase domain-containing protein
VQFAESMRQLGAQDCPILLEIGPSTGLLGSARRTLGRQDVSLLPCFAQGDESLKVLMTSLGSMYTHGVEVDWNGVYKDMNCRRVSLPTYPFERQRHWVEESQPELQGVETKTMALGKDRSDSKLSEPPEAETKMAIIPSTANQNEMMSRRAAILRILRQKLAGLLEMQEDEIEDSVPFLELGADSLVLLEALQGIQDMFGIKLGIRQLFEDFTNLEALALHLDELLPQDFQLQAGALQLVSAAKHDADRITEMSRAEAILVEAVEAAPSNGHRYGSDIADILTKQLETMHEIIARQLQILQDR